MTQKLVQGGVHLWAEVSRIVSGESHQETVAEELKRGERERTAPPYIYLSLAGASKGPISPVTTNAAQTRASPQS